MRGKGKCSYIFEGIGEMQLHLGRDRENAVTSGEDRKITSEERVTAEGKLAHKKGQSCYLRGKGKCSYIQGEKISA